MPGGVSYVAHETSGVQSVSPSELVRVAQARLAGELQSLPAWDTPQLWARVYSRMPQQSISFGAMVHLIRVAARRNQGRVARELFVLLLERTEGLNRRWADRTVHSTSSLHGDAGLAVREDLRQELTLRLWESVALADAESWELFFQRALAYAQRHTATLYMEQRGYWNRRTTGRRATRPEVANSAPRSTTSALSAEVTADDVRDEYRYDVDTMVPEMPMLSAADIASVSSEFAAADLTDLRDLVARLPREQQIAVVLRHWQQASEVEIAETLGVTTRTVRNYLRRAHMRLRELYEGTEALA